MLNDLRTLLRQLADGSVSTEQAIAFVDSHRIGERHLMSALSCTKDDLAKLMSQNHWRRDDLARHMRVSEKQVSRWLGGDTIPPKYGHRILGLNEQDEAALRDACKNWPSVGMAAESDFSLSSVTIGDSEMTLRNVGVEDMCACLTQAQADVGMGAITGYFLFDRGELHAASFDAFVQDDMTLREGYRLVQAPAIRRVCELVEPPGRAISRGDIFGDLKTLIMGFANTVVAMTVPEPNLHLLSIFHPKHLYTYGFALSAQRRLLELTKVKAHSYSAEEKGRLRQFDPYSASSAIRDHISDISLANLLKSVPADLSSLMSRTGEGAAYAEFSQNFSRGFVLLEQLPDKRPTIRSASSSLVEMKGNSVRYRSSCAVLASPSFTDEILPALTEGQGLLHRAQTVEQITGRLRTFWLAFDKAVIGINPFEDRRGGVKGSQYYLVSVYRADSESQLKFNYGEARELTRALCQEADSI